MHDFLPGRMRGPAVVVDCGPPRPQVSDDTGLVSDIYRPRLGLADTLDALSDENKEEEDTMLTLWLPPTAMTCLEWRGQNLHRAATAGQCMRRWPTKKLLTLGINVL